MKIGIFGDSFAAPGRFGLTSWVDHLSAKFDITNYAVDGSSLAYSYELFLEHHSKFDVNILLITNYGRLWMPNLRVIAPGISGMPTIEHHLSYSRFEEDNILLRAAQNYYIHVEYEPHQMVMHKAMVKDLQRHNNVIIIPCFPANNSGVDNWNGATMNDISLIDLKYYHLDKLPMEMRSCHMNDSNNFIFANKMKEYLLSDMSVPFTININDYVEPIGEPIEKYFY